MEGGNRQSRRLGLEQLTHPFLHLLGRPVGEGDRGDVGRAETAFLDQIGDFLCNDACLAGTGASQHQQWTVKKMCIRDRVFHLLSTSSLIQFHTACQQNNKIRRLPKVSQFGDLRKNEPRLAQGNNIGIYFV